GYRGCRHCRETGCRSFHPFLLIFTSLSVCCIAAFRVSCRQNGPSFPSCASHMQCSQGGPVRRRVKASASSPRNALHSLDSHLSPSSAMAQFPGGASRQSEIFNQPLRGSLDAEGTPGRCNRVKL